MFNIKPTYKYIVFVSFITFVLFVYFILCILKYSLNSKTQEGITNLNSTPSTNPIVQVGINSASINSLREELNKINIDAINKELDEMEQKIKTNTENINSITMASNKTNNNDANDNNDNNSN